MNGAEYISKIIVPKGATDVFGVPGAIVLDFLYAVENAEGLLAQLNYHEQTASFAAIGNAQASGKLGVAYSTRGPGVSNMMTAIAEAYYESVPVLFITAHASNEKSNRRTDMDQEVDFTDAIGQCNWTV